MKREILPPSIVIGAAIISSHGRKDFNGTVDYVSNVVNADTRLETDQGGNCKIRISIGAA